MLPESLEVAKCLTDNRDQTLRTGVGCVTDPAREI